MEIIVFFLPLHQPQAEAAAGTQVLSMHLKLVAQAVVVIILLSQAAQLVLPIKVMQVVVAQLAVAEMLAEAEAALTL
jgi:hypothetical protein